MKKGNYSYFPIFIEDNYPLTRDQLYAKLKKKGFNGRRYFYPLITDFPMYKSKHIQKKNLIFAKNISEQVICLPIYPELALNFVKKIIKEIKL